MKRIFYMVTAIFCVACGEKVDPFKGEASALKNGVVWESAAYAVSYAAHPQNYDIVLVVKNEEGILRGQLSLFDIPKDSVLTAKLYRIVSTDTARIDGRVNAVYSDSYQDGDVSGPMYQPIDNTTSNDFVQITSYNKNTNEIEGIFGCTLFNYYDNDSYFPEDSIKFEQGKFKTILKK